MTPSTSGYELSLSCALLATACIFCNRPLVDAESVERGCGSTCAEKHGVGDASELPCWGEAADAVVRACGGDETAARAAVPGFWAAAVAGDTRRGSNAVTARLAARVQGDASAVELAALVAAVRALGYALLANRLQERLLEEGAVKVEADGHHLVVRAPFSPAFNEALRELAPARRWDREAKVWRVPAGSKRGLWGALQRAFAGRVVLSAKGAAVIPGAAPDAAAAA